MRQLPEVPEADVEERVSVLTSCSSLELHRLFRELKHMRVRYADLYFLREGELRALCGKDWAGRYEGVTDALGCLDPGEVVKYVEQAKEVASYPELGISALATFIPQISSNDVEQRAKAAKALRVAVEVARRLGARCVELVCGTAVDPQGEPSEKGFYRQATIEPRETKYRYIIEVLSSVVEACSFPEPRVGLAVEVEPGPRHILNNEGPVRAFFKKVDAQDDQCLIELTGLNADLGHFLMLDIPADHIRDLDRRVFNAHISDHPAHAHFQDLVPGSFHTIYPEPKEFGFANLAQWYLSLSDQDPPIPYHTARIATELEACDRVQWVHRAARRLKFLVRELLVRRLLEP